MIFKLLLLLLFTMCIVHRQGSAYEISYETQDDLEGCWPKYNTFGFSLPKSVSNEEKEVVELEQKITAQMKTVFQKEKDNGNSATNSAIAAAKVYIKWAKNKKVRAGLQVISGLSSAGKLIPVVGSFIALISAPIKSRLRSINDKELRNNIDKAFEKVMNGVHRRYENLKDLMDNREIESLTSEKMSRYQQLYESFQKCQDLVVEGYVQKCQVDFCREIPSHFHTFALYSGDLKDKDWEPSPIMLKKLDANIPLFNIFTITLLLPCENVLYTDAINRKVEAKSNEEKDIIQKQINNFFKTSDPKEQNKEGTEPTIHDRISNYLWNARINIIKAFKGKAAKNNPDDISFTRVTPKSSKFKEAVVCEGRRTEMVPLNCKVTVSFTTKSTIPFKEFCQMLFIKDNLHFVTAITKEIINVWVEHLKLLFVLMKGIEQRNQLGDEDDLPEDIDEGYTGIEQQIKAANDKWKRPKNLKEDIDEKVSGRRIITDDGKNSNVEQMEIV